jgi:uncharacterized cupin superfamily protein
MAVINVFGAEPVEGRIDVAGTLGSAATAMYLYDLSPGDQQCPYHYEYGEEWLLVVDGTIALREPRGQRTLRGGDLVCFPPGPEGAHQIINRSDSPARTLMFSSRRLPAVSVYPDSNTIALWPSDEVDDLVLPARHRRAVEGRRGRLRQTCPTGAKGWACISMC